MAKFDFTKQEYEDILSKVFLNKEEQTILEMKLLDEYEVKIALELGMSVRTLQRKWKKIKDKVKRVI